MTNLRLIAAVLVTAAVSACAQQAPAPAPATTTTVTTTPDVPGADPAAWFEAYCGPMSSDVQNPHERLIQAFRANKVCVNWQALAGGK